MSDLTVTLDTRELDRIVSQLPMKEERIMARLALEIQRMAAELAPVKTSALRNSIYTKTRTSDGFAAASAAAQGNNEKVNLVELPDIGGNVFAIIGPCVDYGEPVEYGHVTKAFTKSYGAQNFVPARPFLTPAARAIEQKFNSGETWRELFERGQK